MPLDPNTQVHLVNTIDECWAMKRWLSEDRGREILGLDTETSGLDPYGPTSALRTIQIGDERAGWTVPVEGWGGAAMECLNDWQGPIALHNASFDVKWLKRFMKWDVPWHRLHDTMIHARIMRPGKAAGLKNLSVELVDPRANAGEIMLKDAMSKQGWGWDTIPVDFEPYWTYGALDPIITAHLWKQLRADIHYPKVFDLEMSVLRICTLMEENGARVDVPYCEEQLDKLSVYVDKTKAWAQENFGVSIGSGPQLVKYFQSVGANIEKVTPSGAPSVNAEQLEIFAKDANPKIQVLAEQTLNARRAEKLSGTYFSNLVKLQRNEIIHPSINTMGALTGRMSSSNPNLQNLPSGGRLVKDAFIPRDGHVMVTSDLDQVEQRLAASFSGDPGLAEAFRVADTTGPDYFTTMAREIFGVPDLTKDDSRRSLTKTFAYAQLYGSGDAKLAKSAGVPIADVKMFVDRLKKRYPRMLAFQEELIDGVQRRARSAGGEAFVELPLTGRRIPVESDKAYKATNYLIQGTAAEIMKLNLVKIDAMGLGEFCVMPVHDEIVMDVPIENIEETMAMVKDGMTTTEGWAVPLTADISGPYERWGEKYK